MSSALTFTDLFGSLSSAWSFETGFDGQTTFSSKAFDGINPTTISNGLNLLAGWTPGPNATLYGNRPYKGAKLSTRTSFSQAHGYVEVVMAASAKAGQTGGVYLSNAITVAEVVSGADTASHTYGFFWGPNDLVWTLDGTITKHVEGATPSTSAYLILQNLIAPASGFSSGGSLAIHSIKIEAIDTLTVVTGSDGKLASVSGSLASITISNGSTGKTSATTTTTTTTTTPPATTTTPTTPASPTGSGAPSYAPGYQLVYSDDLSAVPTIRSESTGSTGIYENKYWYGYPGYVTSHWDGAGPTTVVSPAWSGDTLYDGANGVYNSYTKFKTAGAAHPSDTKYGSGSTYIGGILTTAPNYNNLQAASKLTTTPTLTSGKVWYRGLFECDVKTPNKSGYWPCFWLYCDWMGRKKEIDIAEFQTVNLAQSHCGYHIPSAYGQPRPATTDTTNWLTLPNGGQTSDWHRYGMRWDNDLTFFVDGIQVAQYVGLGTYFDAPMWMIFSGGGGDGSFYNNMKNSMAATDAGLATSFRNAKVWQLPS